MPTCDLTQVTFLVRVPIYCSRTALHRPVISGTCTSSLGSICRAEGSPSEALKWYRSALQTCLDASGVSGGSALKNLLALVGDDIGSEDMALCRAAIARSWAVLGLSGEAATYDLATAITTIKDGETRPRS